MGSAPKTINIINDIAELARVAEAVEAFCDAEGVPPGIVFKINVVLEEVLLNTISYGFEDGGTHEIVVNIAYKDGAIVVMLCDDGKPFDPLQVPLPDLDAPLEERPIGGLGIHLVRTMMDRIEYVRENGRNRLTLTKRVASES